MHVYISVDMEGIGGIATFDQVVRGGHGYPRSQHLMTAETNAAIAGAFDGGADQVLVNDSHGTMDNLLHEELDPRARLLFGSPKLDCMAEGLSADHDVAFFLGYHAAAGAPGVLAHTYSGHFLAVRLNGEPMSEAQGNALQAAAAGVPIGLLTGDDVICAEAHRSFPGVRTVEVKKAHGFSAANSLAPSACRDLIRAAAAEAVRDCGRLRPLPLPAELAVEIDLPNPSAAEIAAMTPGVVRIADKTVRAVYTDPRDLIGLITICYEFATSAVRSRLALVNRT